MISNDYFADLKCRDRMLSRRSRICTFLDLSGRRENMVILYAKTANLSDVLTFVDVSEKVIIVYAQSVIISRF